MSSPAKHRLFSRAGQGGAEGHGPSVPGQSRLLPGGSAQRGAGAACERSWARRCRGSARSSSPLGRELSYATRSIKTRAPALPQWLRVLIATPGGTEPARGRPARVTPQGHLSMEQHPPSPGSGTALGITVALRKQGRLWPWCSRGGMAGLGHHPTLSLPQQPTAAEGSQYGGTESPRCWGTCLALPHLPSHHRDREAPSTVGPVMATCCNRSDPQPTSQGAGAGRYPWWLPTGNGCHKGAGLLGGRPAPPGGSGPPVAPLEDAGSAPEQHVRVRAEGAGAGPCSEPAQPRAEPTTHSHLHLPWGPPRASGDPPVPSVTGPGDWFSGVPHSSTEQTVPRASPNRAPE